jgi:predicted lysophospholipase L1 biosynthesis ABC-type transport system permease subunit
MRRVWLFVLSSGVTAVFAVSGSFVGHTIAHATTLATGHVLVVTGAVVGGLVGAVGFAYLALRLALVTRNQLWPTAAGTGAGFLVAALVAVRTLSSPIGPLLSTVLVGVGALIGARRRAGNPDSSAI